MKKVITYGTYDLLHEGHRRLLQRAKALGNYLIVGVTSDAFDRQRGKLNVSQTLSERIEAVKKTGLADLIIVEEYEGQKVEDIQKYHVDIFAIGSDWQGKFDYLKKYCTVIYLERTKGISSTILRTNRYQTVRLGLIGMGIPTDRFLDELNHVSGIEATAYFEENNRALFSLTHKYNLEKYENLNDFWDQIDAVYIATSRQHNARFISLAIQHKKHVLCESPIFLSQNECLENINAASKQGVIIMEALKTLYFPAYQHLALLIESGVIGEIIDINLSCTQNPPSLDTNNRYEGSMYDFGAYALLPIYQLLGNQYQKIILHNQLSSDKRFCLFTSCFFEYRHATASFRVGKGIKTEGEMIITGTKGYIVVPAPWWKTDYFELRYEDLRDTRKYFYQFYGEGLRYEINEFVSKINGKSNTSKEDINRIIMSSNIMSVFEELLNHDEKKFD